MDIIGYIQALLAAGTPSAYACLGILGFFALSVLWELLHGLRRGFARQLTHTIFMLIAVALAFFATSAVSSYIFGGLGEMSVEEFLALIESSGTAIPEEIRGLITSFDMETFQYLLAFPVSTIIAPVLFAVLFIAINIVLKLVSFLVCKIARIRKRRGFFRRIGGLLVGAVEGVLVACVILLPVAGITSSLDGAVAIMREEESNTELVSMYDEFVAPVTECPIFPLINSYGGDFVISHFATVYIDGNPQDLRVELASGIKIYAEVMKLTGVNLKNLTNTDKGAIDSLIDIINGSDYVLTLASGLLRGLAYSVDNGHLSITAEPPFDKLIDPFLKVFETSEKTNLDDDLTTLKKVIYILSDEGVFIAIDSGNSTTLSNVFTKEDENGKTVINEVIELLNSNQHTRPIVATLTEISLAMLCDSMGIDGETAALYENVKAGVAATIAINPDDYATDEEYVAAISDSLNQTLASNDINLEPEIVDSMANYIKDNKVNLNADSEDDINNVILNYYDSYLEYMKNNPSGGDELPGDIDIPGVDNLPEGDDNIDDDGLTN